MAFLSPPPASRDDYARLLASPAGSLLPSPLARPIFGQASPHKGAFAVQEGRLSFDVLLQEHDNNEHSAGAAALEGLPEKPTLLNSGRSATHLELFTLAAKSGAGEQLRPAVELHALTQAVVAKAVAAKEQEAAALVAAVAAKYGLAADYDQVQDTIKAVWAEPRKPASRGSSPAAVSRKPEQSSQQQTGGGEELTLAIQAKVSSDNMSCDEEAGQQATSVLKPLNKAAGGQGGGGLKRPLSGPATFSFHVPAQPNSGAAAAAAAAADDAAQKRRRVQYDRMRELEAQVQRVRHMGDALKQSLRQSESQHELAVMENEQLWSALLHIHASLRAAHAATLKQQVAMHAAAMVAALPPSLAQAAEPSPAMFPGNFFSPDAAELAAACGMFMSPGKVGAANPAAANKPRKLFLEEDASKAAMGLTSVGRPSRLGNAQVEISPALWVHAA